MAHNVPERGTGQSSEDGEQKNKLGLARRALLTRGGVVAAGVVGAGAVAAVAAGPAAAAAGDPILQDQVNSAGTSATPTELDADNATAPAFIVANTGQDTTSGVALAGPNIRLTPSTATGVGPTASTGGGDLTATSDGELWFTHDLSNETLPAGESPIQPWPVHTELNSNVFAVLATPVRLLDTRSASLRTFVLNPSVLASNGELPAKATLFLDLDSLVIFADTMFANVTVTGSTAAGFLTVWSGATSTPPNSSNINYSGGQTIANFTAVGTGIFPAGSANPTSDNSIAIFADTATHVIVDAIAFTMPGFEYLQPTASTSSTAQKSLRASRLARAQAAVRAAKLS